MKKLLFISGFFLLGTFAFAELSISVSKNKYNQTINSYDSESGVLPVEVVINDSDFLTGKKYSISRSEKGKNDFTLISEITANSNSDLIFYDTSKDFLPEIMYEYKVSSGKTVSNIDYGYGALTYEKFFQCYDEYIFRSQGKLTLMHKPKNLDKLGKETITGEFSGSLSYSTKVSGLSGIVIMFYDNYSDSPNWIFTGNTNTKANMSANGNMYGTMEIKGMYPGKIFYDKLILKDGAAGGGYYGIQPAGCDYKEFSYTIAIRHE